MVAFQRQKPFSKYPNQHIFLMSSDIFRCWFITIYIDVSNVRWLEEKNAIWVSTKKFFPQECRYQEIRITASLQLILNMLVILEWIQNPRVTIFYTDFCIFCLTLLYNGKTNIWENLLLIILKILLFYSLLMWTITVW